MADKTGEKKIIKSYNKAKDKIIKEVKGIKGSKEKRKSIKKIGIIASIIITLFLLLWGLGYLSQTIGKFITQSGEVNGNILTCLSEIFSGKPHTVFLWMLFLLILVFIGRFFYVIIDNRFSPEGNEDEERNFMVSEMGDFGTNKSLTSKEAMSFLNFHTEFEDCKEFIIGEDSDTKEIITLKPIEETFLNPNIAIIGTPGTMKTRAIINNYMFQAIRQKRSVLCIDTKGSLYSDFYELAKSAGYTQRILNLCELDKSDGFDPLKITGDDSELVSVLAQVIIDNTSDENDKDRFFDAGEMSLLKAITLLVTHDGGEEGFTYIKDAKDRTIVTVYKTILTTTIEDLATTFVTIAETEPDHPALLPWNLFLKGGKVSNNFIVGLGGRLQLLQNTKVQKILSHGDIDLSLPGKEPCIYYLRLPDSNTTYNFISSLFITLFYFKLTSLADSRDERILKNLVTALLDEFCTAGKIPDFKQKISSVRSRGIATVLAIQNIPQIKDRYEGNQWEEILSDCDTTLFLGTNDNTTADYMSKLCGTMTISTVSEGYRYNTEITSPIMFNDANTRNERDVFTHGEVLNKLSVFEELVKVRGKDVYKCSKYDYSKHPDFKYIKPKNVTTHIPLYVQMGEEETPETKKITPMSIGQRNIKSKKAADEKIAEKFAEEVRETFKENDSAEKISDKNAVSVPTKSKKSKKENSDNEKVQAEILSSFGFSSTETK